MSTFTCEQRKAQTALTQPPALGRRLGCIACSNVSTVGYLERILHRPGQTFAEQPSTPFYLEEMVAATIHYRVLSFNGRVAGVYRRCPFAAVRGSWLKLTACVDSLPRS